MSGLTIVFGTAGFTAGHNYPTPADAKVVLDAVYDNGVRHIDTAQLYGDSEEFLGANNAGDRFNIDTKAKGGFDPNNSLQPDNLYKNAPASLSKLKVKQVDIFYIHAPDASISPATWLPVVDKLHKEGVFKRLGVSNFHAEQVREVYDLAKSKGYVLPSVFQGNYSPVTRKQETDLFPLLRELNIAFYAYSPLAGGFLAKTKQGLLDGVKEGRFATGDGALNNMYRDMYLKDTLLDALDEWVVAAKEEGVSQAELAYRWVSFHSPLKPENGDAIIIGARHVGQAVETISGLKKGPLKASVVAKIDEVWEKVKNEAPLDNFNSHAKQALGG
jgi:aryl-alcohol dehydrogenase-like predicted oxidoreductase